MIEKIRKIYTAIQLIPENDLTKTVIKPVLEKLGFLKVEFYGGQDEEGKDLLCWNKDPLGDISLIVAQVKHFKFSNKASGNLSFQNIVNQLTMSLLKEVHYSDKSIHFPEKVYLISSKEIDSKNIKTRFSTYPSIDQSRIKIIDGYLLAELILKNCPNIASKLINEDIDLSYYSSENLTNETLLKALGFNKKINLKSIYTDIDFSLGKQTTRLFFNTQFKGITKEFTLDKIEWNNFKIDLEKLDEKIINDILNQNIEKIELNFKLQFEEFKKWEDIDNLKKAELIERENIFKEVVNKNKSDWTYFRKKQSEYNELVKRKKNKKTEKSITFDRLNNELIDLKRKLIDVFKEEKKVETLSKFLEHHISERPNPKYYFSINGKEIESILIEDKKFIVSEIRKFNLKKPSSNELKEYLKKCHVIFQKSSILLNNDRFLQSLGINSDIKLRESLESTRFKLPINKIFDTNLNLVLLGEAGAGKTTSLQMYAINNKESEDKIILWAPLIRLVQNWSLNKNDEENKTKIKSLDLAICEYLRSKNINLSTSEILDIFNKKKIVVLFDGLDESIKSNEWLPEAINYLAKKYSLSFQIIVTSRMTGEYIEKLQFLTVTLLPFTKEQRNQFITKWFDKKDADIRDKILQHFKENKSIDETTRNPLLTTTLCVLAKHNLPLPNTEIKLYDDRLKLLAGYYDNVKNIPTRISTTPHNLEYLSKKIAYFLHSKFIREIEYTKLEEYASQCMGRLLSPKMTKTALKELIDPCNILVPMTDTGKFGFGHLRYQEHLAASELSTSRGINIHYLMTQIWWRESLIFFAQMSDDLIWLTKDIGYYIGDKKFISMLNELIKLRPKKEQNKINALIKEYSENFSLVYDDSLYNSWSEEDF